MNKEIIVMLAVVTGTVVYATAKPQMGSGYRSGLDSGSITVMDQDGRREITMYASDNQRGSEFDMVIERSGDQFGLTAANNNGEELSIIAEKRDNEFHMVAEKSADDFNAGGEIGLVVIKSL